MSDDRIRLAPLTSALRASVLALKLADAQLRFVADNGSSLKEAARDRNARPRAVIAGDAVVGFLMYDAPQDGNEARIYRFMIDAAQQGRGFGRAALMAALAEIATDGYPTVSICYEPENAAAKRLYASAGFVEQGLDEDGEMIAALSLKPSP